MTHVLIFGASGFIGRHVQDALVQDSRVDRVTTLAETAATCWPPRWTSSLRATPAGTGRRGQLHWSARRYGLPAVAIQHAGTGQTDRRHRRRRSRYPLHPVGVGGRVRAGAARARVAEDDQAAPVGDYGLSHLAATRLLELARAAGRADAVTLRVFNPIGPGLREENLLGRAAARLRDAVTAGADFITMGPLSPCRDFLDARDLGKAVVAAALAPALPTAVINCGSGRAMPARTAVELLAEAAGFSGEIREAHPPSRSATVDWILADISRAVEVLGWRPTHALADSTKAIWGAMVAESRAGR